MTTEEKENIKRQQEIEKILYRFVGDSDLHESCQALLDCLRIKYTEISPATLPPDAFFDPTFVEKNGKLLDKLDNVSVVGIASQDTFLAEERLTISREEMEKQLENDRYKEMAFFSIDAKASLTRTEIASITRAFNRRMHYRPVVLFIRFGNLLSMATCERSEYIQQGHEGEKVGKVTILRNIDCNHPHHGHVIILSALDISSCKSSFDAVYEHWLATFSNELLTKKFYQELSDWFFWAIKNVRYPNNLDDPNDDEKFNHENVIRLVTRLIFVWFLKEKHLIPEEFFDEAYIRENLIRDFNPNEIVDLFYKSTESKYYKAILQNLFFATLNCPIIDPDTGKTNNRHFGQGGADDSNSKVMKHKKYFINPDLFVNLVNSKVPFLNGGLFDCLDDSPKHLYYDGFSEKEEISKYLVIPDYLFFGDKVGKNIDLSEEYGDKKKKKVSTRGIIDILKRYNFTIEENTPFDQEVSLDPELLGKVFENLLASYNPETKTTARKQTGSFYTPRDIVQYMVDESIIEHLKKTVDNGAEQLFRDLVSYSSGNIDISDELKTSIMKSIYNCKVLDPACGSGAFPVGMLQQMVHILSRIDPKNKKWEELIIDAATSASREAFQTESQVEREEKLADIYATFDEKLNYPDYARKLYIIENCIYGVDIQPIAIQISHLRFFISLIVDQKENPDPTKNFGIRPLPNLEAKFVAANSLIPLNKGANLFNSTPKYIELEKKLNEANHQIFTAKSPQKKAAWKRILKERRQEMADMLVEGGFVDEFAGSQIAGWDMFDQNSFASFFDAEWMFGIKDGFDIVIGNPPYIRRTSLSESDKIQYEKIYHSAHKQYDIYLLFIEKGINSLKNGGCICYINPIRYFNADYGEKCREFIVGKHSIISILDVSQLSVFENAMTYPCVTLIRNSKQENNNITYIKPDKLSDILNIRENTKTIFPQAQFEGDSFLFVIPKNIVIENIISKVDSSNCTISKYYDVARGLANKLVNFNGTGIKAIKSKQVDRYYIIDQEIDIDTDHSSKFSQGMLILPRTVKVLKATYKRPGLVLLDRIYFLTLLRNQHVNQKFVLGVLNSALTNFWFEYYYSSTKVSGGYFDLNGNQIKSIPLPVPKQEIVNEISTLVDEVMRLKKIGEDSTLLEYNIDNKVCASYGLSYDEARYILQDAVISKEEYESML